LGNCNRLMLRNIEAVRKGHRDEARGWGRTRKERERKKVVKGAHRQLDERLVVNDEGDVCIAEDYDGDVEEGMARYEKELGMGTPGPRRTVPKEVAPPFVPDYARWKPPAVGEVSGAEEGGGFVAHAVVAAETFEQGDGTAEGVPLMPCAEGEQANLQ